MTFLHIVWQTSVTLWISFINLLLEWLGNNLFIFQFQKPDTLIFLIYVCSIIKILFLNSITLDFNIGCNNVTKLGLNNSHLKKLYILTVLIYILEQEKLNFYFSNQCHILCFRYGFLIYFETSVLFIFSFWIVLITLTY